MEERILKLYNFTKIRQWFKKQIIMQAFKYIASVEMKRIYHKGMPNSPDPYERASSDGTKFIIILTDGEKLTWGKFTYFRED